MDEIEAKTKMAVEMFDRLKDRTRVLYRSDGKGSPAALVVKGLPPGQHLWRLTVAEAQLLERLGFRSIRWKEGIGWTEQ